MSQTLLLLNLAVGTVLPALVGFVTHRKAPAQVKSLLLLSLAAVAAVLTTSIQQGKFDLSHVTVSFATTFLTAVGAHFGLLKPTGVTGEAGAVSGVGLSIGEPAVLPNAMVPARVPATVTSLPDISTIEPPAVAPDASVPPAAPAAAEVSAPVGGDAAP